MSVTGIEASKYGRIMLPTKTLEMIVSSILSATPAQEIYVFGSYARQEQGPESDIDLFVITEDTSHQTLADIRGSLSWLPMHKDVLTQSSSAFEEKRSTFGRIEHEVAKEGVRIYG